MKIAAVAERARALGIHGAEALQKGEMIRAIQMAEGNRPCFGNLWRFDCLQFDCCWREDCLIEDPG